MAPLTDAIKANEVVLAAGNLMSCLLQAVFCFNYVLAMKKFTAQKKNEHFFEPAIFFQSNTQTVKVRRARSATVTTFLFSLKSAFYGRLF